MYELWMVELCVHIQNPRRDLDIPQRLLEWLVH
jgi:hypothetical protein